MEQLHRFYNGKGTRWLYFLVLLQSSLVIESPRTSQLFLPQSGIESKNKPENEILGFSSDKYLSSIEPPNECPTIINGSVIFLSSA